MPDALLGGIVISEFLADPNGVNNFDTDGNGAARGGDEFIELANTSSSAIDISGLELWDAGRDNWFTFPTGSILEAGAVAVVVRNVQNGGSLPTVTGDNLAFDADYASNVFNNGGDNLVIYDPTNDEFIQATFNGDSLDDPTTGSNYAGFSSTATRVGTGEDFGNDQDGFSIQRDGTGFTNNTTPTPGMNLCFVTGTQIETPSGFVDISRLAAGDLVQTLDAGFQPICWIFSSAVTRQQLQDDPSIRPIRVGVSDTKSSLRVSRHHRLLVQGKITRRMYDQDQILVPAKDLIADAEFSTDDSCEPFKFYHILLRSHCILNANGVAAESLHLGEQALQSLSKEALADLRQLLHAGKLGQSCRPSRPMHSGAKVRSMVARHIKNGHQTVTPFHAEPQVVQLSA